MLLLLVLGLAVVTAVPLERAELGDGLKIINEIQERSGLKIENVLQVDVPLMNLEKEEVALAYENGLIKVYAIKNELTILVEVIPAPANLVDPFWTYSHNLVTVHMPVYKKSDVETLTEEVSESKVESA